MKPIGAFALAVVVSWCQAQAQVLNPGDTLVYHFDTLPLIGAFPNHGDATDQAGSLEIRLLYGTFLSGDDFRVEMFEGDTNTAPFYSNTFNNPTTLYDQGGVIWVPNTWQDLNGSIRLTGLSGVVEFNGFRFSATLPDSGNPGLYDLYSAAVPVPEPTGLSLGIMGCGLLGLRMCLRRSRNG